ncbi:zinc finger protein 853-like [Scleropages formosus]|uniref:zinc finger protein 853-like n=1 Tax=Scleropages formosus TaxID=113540 RepID=UPI0010FAB48C|nr:zinc finger protein 853-like [Scleropages formosus]
MNCVAFHTQLASIMDILASAAVAEICKLVEEGFAALRLQIRERDGEIGALRDRLKKTETSSPPVRGENTRLRDPCVSGHGLGSAELELLLKEEEEKLKEEQVENTWNIWNKEPKGGLRGKGFEQLEAEEDDDDKGSTLNTQTSPAAHTEQPCLCEASVLEVAVKAEPMKEDVNQDFAQREPQCPAETRRTVDPEYFLPERICPFGSSVVREDGELVAGGTRVDSGSRSLQSVSDSRTNVRGLTDDGNIRSTCIKTYRRDIRKQKPFLCKYCGKDFARRSVFETHLRIHTGEKPFSCAQCHRRFSDMSCYKRHQTVHTGEKPFSCVFCGKCFIRSYHLRRHHQQIHVGQVAAAEMGCNLFSQGEEYDQGNVTESTGS